MKNWWAGVYHYLDRLSHNRIRNRASQYGLVILLVLLLFSIKAVLFTAIQKDVPLLFSLFIVIISAWFGGFGPGIFATFLSGILTYILFLEPKFTFFGTENISNFTILIVFFLEGLLISILIESRRRSDAQKSEFIGVVSHELKKPLTSIKGYAELIQKTAKLKRQPKLADFGGRIDTQVKQVIDMITELLDVTKIETGRLTYQHEPFSLMDLVKEIVSDQQVTTDTHKIQVSGRIKAIITADRYRIGQVITNIISNAIKYSPQSKKVRVIVAQEKNTVIVSVQDYGLGIAKEDQSKLFQPFFRAKNSGSAKGTGIGLFISSQIIQHHKGRLQVKSEKDKGSVFSLTLPLRK